MKDCDLIQPLMGAYLDGELETNLAERLAGHLQECNDCRKLLENIAEMDTLLHLDQVELPPAAEWNVVERRLLLRSTFFSMKRVVKVASVAAAAVFLFVALYLIVDKLSSGSNNQNRPALYTTEHKVVDSPAEPPLKISVDRG